MQGWNLERGYSGHTLFRFRVFETWATFLAAPIKMTVVLGGSILRSPSLGELPNVDAEVQGFRFGLEGNILLPKVENHMEQKIESDMVSGLIVLTLNILRDLGVL